jgi:hypothetical protein
MPDVRDIPLREFRQLSRAVHAGRRAAEEALAGGAKERLERAQRTSVVRVARATPERGVTATASISTS